MKKYKLKPMVKITLIWVSMVIAFCYLANWNVNRIDSKDNIVYK